MYLEEQQVMEMHDPNPDALCAVGMTMLCCGNGYHHK